ncbi:helix-turn-helix domain-containing protein [Bacillus sp. N9]
MKIRINKNLTLTEVANRARIAKSYLSNIERNINQNPSIHIVEKIANVLNVDVKTLIQADSNWEKEEPEWVEFINELKKVGNGKERIHEMKILLEFIKWQNESVENHK